MSVKIGDKIMVRVSSEYVWCRVEAIDYKTYDIPMFTARVTESLFIGETLVISSFIDHQLGE